MAQGAGGCVCTATAGGASRRLPQSRGGHGGHRLPVLSPRRTARLAQEAASLHRPPGTVPLSTALSYVLPSSKG